MTDTSQITAQEVVPEHPEKGVGTGMANDQVLVFAAKSLEVLASGWSQSNVIHVSLLRALLRLSQRQPEQVEIGFDAWELAEVIGEVRSSKWAAGDTRDGVAEKVRTHWKTLVGKTWPQKIEGINQYFRDVGLDCTPQLRHKEGGGQGNPTRYGFSIQPLSAADELLDEAKELIPVTDKSPGETVVDPSGNGRISYICEDVEDASWLARTFAAGVLLQGWPRLLLSATLKTGILLLALVALLVPLTVFSTGSISNAADAVFALVIVAFAFWRTLGALLMLHRERIALAPWWMQSVDDDRLIEFRCPPRFQENAIKAVRYTAKCPLCGGRVVVRSGGMKHGWRLVGCCEETPQAHVFTFDHVLRTGDRLNHSSR